MISLARADRTVLWVTSPSVSQSGTQGAGGWQQVSLSCCGIDGVFCSVLLLGGRRPLEKSVDDSAQAQQAA